MHFTGRQHGLKAHDTFTFHFAQHAVGIHDHPMAAQQLNRMRTAVFNGDVVTKNKFSFPWIRVSREVFRLYADGDVVGGERFHIPKLSDAVSAESITFGAKLFK